MLARFDATIKSDRSVFVLLGASGSVVARENDRRNGNLLYQAYVGMELLLGTPKHMWGGRGCRSGQCSIMRECDMSESGLKEWKEVQISMWELGQNSESGVPSSQVQVQI